MKRSGPLRTDRETHDAWQARSRERAAARAKEKPRKPLAQSKPLSPMGDTLKRTGPLPKRNPERLAKRRRDQFGEHAEWIRSLPCVLAGHDAGDCGPSVAAHVKSRGAGGKAADLVPLCQRHHDEQHAVGILTFQERYEIDLAAIAADLWANREASWAL